MGCASGSYGGTVDDKVWGGDVRDIRESSPQPGRRLRRWKGYRAEGDRTEGDEMD